MKKADNPTDQASNDNAQNEDTVKATTDNETAGNDSNVNETADNTDSSVNEGKDSYHSSEHTAETLLELNQVWSLVKTAELEQPDFTVPAYQADTDFYTIAEDLTNVENIDRFVGFTDDQKKMLAENGFIVLPDRNTKIYYVYEGNEYTGIPNFVTSDSVLHLYHQFYDKSLMSIESDYLFKDLDQMTKQLLDKSILLNQQLTDEDLKVLQDKNIVYFLVARMLFLQSEDVGVTVDVKLSELAAQEYQLAKAAKGIEKSPMLGLDLDYSQFTVRGHYTRSEELGRFFKTMMWFGLVPLSFQDVNSQSGYDNVLQALLMTYTVIANSQGTCDAELWSGIYQPTALYAGLSDDINLFTMNGLRSSVYGDNENPDIYNDMEYRDKLIEAVKALPQPQIQGRVVSSIPTGLQFRFMGQRYIPDSEILQELMGTKPTALEVMGVLGSNTAEDLLFLNYRLQDEWPDFTDKYNKLKEQFSRYDSSYWKKNLYSGWLWSLQEVLKEYPADSGMPFFMTTKAWRYKSLNTALGSFTELKHDSVLYGKQAMAEMGGPLDEEEKDKLKHYVEPDIELYNKLIYLTDFTRSELEVRGMLNDSLKHGAKEYIDFLKFLIQCSVKELQNKPLTKEENDKLLWCGGTMENICGLFLNGSTANNADYAVKDPTDMLVTDIATYFGSPLTLGTGYFDDIYVIVPCQGKLYMTRGAVYSSYEFLGSKRLTDEEWWKLLGVTVVHSDYGDYEELGEPSKELPKQSDWISSFKSTTNNVTITSLEVDWDNLVE